MAATVSQLRRARRPEWGRSKWHQAGAGRELPDASMSNVADSGYDYIKAEEAKAGRMGERA